MTQAEADMDLWVEEMTIIALAALPAQIQIDTWIQGGNGETHHRYNALAESSSLRSQTRVTAQCYEFTYMGTNHSDTCLIQRCQIQLVYLCYLCTCRQFQRFRVLS
jgi:hypothetical protein